MSELASEVEVHADSTAAHGIETFADDIPQAAETNNSPVSAQVDGAGSTRPSDNNTDCVSAGVSQEQQQLLRGSSSASFSQAATPADRQSEAIDVQPAVPRAEERPDLQQQAQPNLDAAPVNGLIVPTDAPEVFARSNKLLALKQRRLGSLSSSLDLSRESSFDVSAHHAVLDDAGSSLQNSLAMPTHHEQPPMQDNTDLNEQASTSLAHLPLDSMTGAHPVAPVTYMS